MAVLADQRRRLQHLGDRLQQTPASQPALAAFQHDRRRGGALLAGALAFRLFALLLPLALLLALTVEYAKTVDDGSPANAASATGIREATLDSIAQSTRLQSGTRGVVAIFTLFATVYAAVKVARAVHAVHSLAWTGAVRPFRRQVGSGLLVLAAVLAIALVWGVAGRARAELGALGIVVAVGSLIPFFAIWLGVSLRLPHGDAPWTALIPGAALAAAGIGVIHLGTVLVIAHYIERASATYGALGVSFTLLMWLFIASRVIVASAMLNAVLWQRHTPERSGP